GHNRTAIARESDAPVLVLTERLGKGGVEHDLLPIAITPKGPVATKGIAEAIREWGGRLLEHLRAATSVDEGARTFGDAAFDVLLRRPPLAAGPAPVVDGRTANAIVESLAAVTRGTVAVQGPPGTGKTFTGSHVIAALVEQGWKVGVVAQSHTTVEHMLDAVVGAGVEASLVGKSLKDEKD